MFILCSFTYLTDHPRSIAGKKMSGKITEEEMEEMRVAFDEFGEFDLRYSDTFIFFSFNLSFKQEQSSMLEFAVMSVLY